MRRWTLLFQFSILSLALFIVIGALLGWGLTTYFEQEAIQQQKASVEFLVPPVVGDYLTDEVLAVGAPDDPADKEDTYSQIETALSSIGGAGSNLARIWIYNKEGMIVYSDRPDWVGKRFSSFQELDEAYNGRTAARISPRSREENIEELGFAEALEVFTPLTLPGENDVKGAYYTFWDIDSLRLQIELTTRFSWTSIITGFLFLYVSLFTIVRDASQRIAQQSSENTMLLADTERKAARLGVINELARSINQSTLNLDEVFGTALRGIDRIVAHTGAGITLLDDRTGAPIATTFLPSPTTQAIRITDADLETEKRLLGNSDTFLSNNTRFHGDPALVGMSQHGIVSLFLVSLRLGERKLGVVRVISDVPNAFDEEDAAMLKGVADQLAVAVENTRLIRETAETTALRETNRLKDEFVSMVSHELRTPLASIKGYARTLLSDSDGHWDEQTHREFLGIIADESDKLAELVENVLEMSRIGAGRLPITPEPILPKRFCKEVVDRIATHYPDTSFECALDEPLPMVSADPRRVEQVLMNLLQNAAKYAGAETVRVLGAYSTERHKVVVSVADNGKGIAPEHLPYLFDKFYRVEPEGGEKGSGTGLGLTIAKALVEAQGGEIWVDSTPGRGTTFSFTLPVLLLDYAEVDVRGNAPVTSV